MKRNLQLVTAMLAAALAGCGAGSTDRAQDAPAASARGHYEWRSLPQYGPRATGPARVRVWVPAAGQMASCDCAMMQASAADCMRGAVKPNNG